MIKRSFPMIALIVATWALSSDLAAAQSRLFSCPHARVVELTVNAPNSVSANPIVVHASNELVEMARAGSIRVLATSDRQRSAFFPDVPTFLELGHQLQGTGWYGLFAPAGTPNETVTRLNAIVVDALARKDVAERIAVLGLRPATTSPDEFAKIQQRDIALWAPAVKASGFAPSQ